MGSEYYAAILPTTPKDHGKKEPSILGNLLLDACEKEALNYKLADIALKFNDLKASFKINSLNLAALGNQFIFAADQVVKPFNQSHETLNRYGKEDPRCSSTGV